MNYFKNMELADIEGEVWKDIVGFENLYLISNFGRVKSRRRLVVKIRKQYLREDGYLEVKLYKNHKSINKRIHRLVVSHFIGGYSKEFNVTNHKNCITSDNRVENLEICDCAYNNKYAYEYGGKQPIRLCGIESPVRVPVVQLDLLGNFISEFDTSKEAYNAINITGLRLYKPGNKLCTNKGYIFMSKTDYDNNKKTDNSIDLPKFRTYKTDKITKIATKELKKVAQLDNDENIIEIFDSIKLAEKKIGKKGVIHVCIGRKHIDKKRHKHFRKTRGGFKWKYYDES